MEFVSHRGSHHLLEPIGYKLIRKTVHTKRGVHSATEQYSIHCFAAEFESPVLKIPAPHALETSKTYTMEHVHDITHRVPKSEFKRIPVLYEALCRFHEHMQYHGYWPTNYTILLNAATNLFYLCDFSKFGTIDKIQVRFPFYKDTVTLLEAELMHGILVSHDEFVVVNEGDMSDADLYG